MSGIASAVIMGGMALLARSVKPARQERSGGAAATAGMGGQEAYLANQAHVNPHNMP
jgi:hypothetical protein